MSQENAEVIDSQLIAENIGFLDNCFDNSFTLQASLIAVKEYVADEQNDALITKIQTTQASKKNTTVLHNKSVSFDCAGTKNAEILSQIEAGEVRNKNLKDWGLPQDITRKYEERGIKEMFDWQVTCLANPKILMDCSNLVYSAPTSAGKTLVAEILTIKTILERQKKVIIILPFVSIVREKMFYLQDILSPSGIRVEGFMGSQSPPGGLQSVHVAICTIEKANSLVNRLLDDGNISELGAVIVDELHLLGDPHRGYILELLLTKIKYVTSSLENVQIQIVGMSATLPNLEVLAHWLEAELFVTQFRPIPLDEFCLVRNKVFNKKGIICNLCEGSDDSDNVLKICLNTIKEDCSVLIFCMTKNRCENLAQSLASSFFKLGCHDQDMGTILRQQLNTESISEVLEQLKNSPVGLDKILQKAISFGVAYHHAGLTFDERDIIEGAFKSGAIRVLVATSTLSSGVNLPARRVIVRSPVFQRQPINILTYKQMIGRAGRMGKDTKGESILICTEAEKKIGFDLMMGALNPVKSCIESEDKYMRAVLEMIASQVACTKDELDLYSKCTLLFTQQSISVSQKTLLDKTLKELQNFELVRVQVDGDDTKYVATPLGKACLSSSMAPNDGLSLFCELQKARQCLVLETDLHLIYLVTPYSVSSQWGDIDWLHLLTLWESLTKAMKRVGELVGVQESFIIRCLRGTNKFNDVQNKLNVHKRFYTALALQDLVNEVPLSEVASKFQCARGFLQSLQQAAATFAGMVTAFCHQLGWKNMEMLISQFQDRLHFGIHSELLELMKLPSLNGTRARTLFDAGFETVSNIASAEVNAIENALYKSVPFQSDKERDGDDIDDVRKRKKMKNIWITGCCGMTAKEAAEKLVSEARKYLELEIGVKEIKWGSPAGSQSTDIVNKSTENTDNVIYDQILIVKQEVNDIQTSGSPQEECNDEVIIKEEDPLASPLHNTEFETDKLLGTAVDICKSSANNVKGELSRTLQNNSASNDILNDSVTIEKQSFRNSLPNNTSSPIIHVKNNVRDSKNISPLLLKTLTMNRGSPSGIKEAHLWDTMSFTEVDLGTLTKLNVRSQNNESSPNISFGESTMTVMEEIIQNENSNSKTNSQSNSKIQNLRSKFQDSKITVKDISLFSSDGDNSSLFEESLPVEMIPSKLLDGRITHNHKITQPGKQETDFVIINSNSILNEFKTGVSEILSEEEDIKLQYEEDDRVSESEHVGIFNVSEDIEVEETQIVKVTPSPYFFMRLSPSSSNNLEPSAKRLKKSNNQIKIKEKKSQCTSITKQKFSTPRKKTKPKKCMKLNTKSLTFTMQMNKEKMECYVFDGADIDNFVHLVNGDDVAISIVKKTRKQLPLAAPIGSNIIYSDIVTKDETDSIKGIALYFGENTCVYLDLRYICDDTLKDVKIKLIHLLQHQKNVRVLRLKEDFVEIKKCLGVALSGSCFDVCLAEWLLTSNERASAFQLAKKYYDLKSFKINIREVKYNALNEIETCCFSAWAAWHVAEKQRDCLISQYENMNLIEMETKVSKILAESEVYGIAVNKDLASKLLTDIKSCKQVLERNARFLSGRMINLHSVTDVAKALGIFCRSRKVSTNKAVLSAHSSPIASTVIYWRKLDAILTKTLYPLTEKAYIFSKEDRINPCYSLMSSTGRVSMREPNLQCVPRTFSIPASFVSDTAGDNTDDIEFNCRNIFKASPGHVLVSADYCQLEMRIMAHYSGDAVLAGIMRSDVDVFRGIAAAWGGVAEEEVDEDLRQKAKQLCYGIIYGMGSKALAQQLDTTELEAKHFMDCFHATYPQIQVYIKKVIEECKKNGYVETLMKRRRYLPNINLTMPSHKNLAERQALNTTIQGTAADIAKAAMCSIDERIESLVGHTKSDRTQSDRPKPHLVLQMHDELIYDVPENQKYYFIKIIKECMEEIVKLNVPLPVKVRTGQTWGSLKEIKFYNHGLAILKSN